MTNTLNKKENKIDEYIDGVVYELFSSYRLTKKDAENIVDRSNLRKLYEDDFEMMSHEPFENVVNDVFMAWVKKLNT